MNTEFSGFVKLFLWGYNAILLRCMEKSYELLFWFCLIDLFLTAYTNIFFHTSLKCYFSHLNLFVNVLDTKTGWLVLVCFVVLLKKSLIKWCWFYLFIIFPSVVLENTKIVSQIDTQMENSYPHNTDALYYLLSPGIYEVVRWVVVLI